MRRALAVAALLAAACHPAAAPVAPAPEPGTVVLPPDYDPARAYPVVEILPATGSTADAILQIYLSQVGLGRLYREPPARQLAALLPYLFPDTGHAGRDVILMLARGRGSARDYGSAGAWARTIERYERQVVTDLRALAAARRVDTTRLVLAGFSMGGDLAWAITLRNPSFIRGAIVMASRATYRPDPEAARTLVFRGTRFFLTMGDADDRTRRRLAWDAAQTLERLGVRSRFNVVPGAGHGPAPPAVFAQGLDFVLGP